MVTHSTSITVQTSPVAGDRGMVAAARCTCGWVEYFNVNDPAADTAVRSHIYWATTDPTVNLTEAEFAAANVLNEKGAFCGECGREPGEPISDCEDCTTALTTYATALTAAGLLARPGTIERLRKAVTDYGANPNYHRQQMAHLQTMWPELWAAVMNVIRADGTPEAQPGYRVTLDPNGPSRGLFQQHPPAGEKP